MRGLASGRCLALAGLALVARASRDVLASPTGDSNIPTSTSLPEDDDPKHLAVVVPAYRGDLDRAVASLERWPTNCSPLTVQSVDLVLYYAEGEEDRSAVEEAAGAIAATAGRCFANLRIVYAHLEEEVRHVFWSRVHVASSVLRDGRLMVSLANVFHPSAPLPPHADTLITRQESAVTL